MHWPFGHRNSSSRQGGGSEKSLDIVRINSIAFSQLFPDLFFKDKYLYYLVARVERAINR